MHKPQRIKGFRRTFAGTQTQPVQHGVVIVKPVHRHHARAHADGRYNRLGKGGFTGPRWAGNPDDKPVRRRTARGDFVRQIARCHAASVTPSGSFAPVI